MKIKNITKKPKLQNVIASIDFKKELISAILEGEEDTIIIGYNKSVKTFNRTIAMLHVNEVLQKYSL
jgi:hypothetical protein